MGATVSKKLKIEFRQVGAISLIFDNLLGLAKISFLSNGDLGNDDRQRFIKLNVHRVCIVGYKLVH